VASAVTAGGIEAFVPWPATTSVTVAADRDEAKEGAGYQRGVSVRVVLPGEPGESVDWLDIFLRDGSEAVRSGINDATLFDPAPKDISENEDRLRREQRLEAIRRQYPLPSLGSLPLKFDYTKQDEIWLHRREPDKSERQSGNGSGCWIAVSSPLGIIALLQKSDCDDAYGLRVAVEDVGVDELGFRAERAQLQPTGPDIVATIPRETM
jgi:hypothetical protein